MTDVKSQEVDVTVEGVITRLLPCEHHAALATGDAWLASGGVLGIDQAVPAGDRVVQNPNGYRHDCADCASAPTMQETLERTVTRHVL